MKDSAAADKPSIMNLIFEETANRNQCGCEFTVNGTRLQCTFSTSQIVRIPQGVSYENGNLSLDETVSGSTLPICKNHEGRLKNAFAKLFN